jgi:hypothetical protein
MKVFKSIKESWKKNRKGASYAFFIALGISIFSGIVLASLYNISKWLEFVFLFLGGWIVGSLIKFSQYFGKIRDKYFLVVLTMLCILFSVLFRNIFILYIFKKNLILTNQLSMVSAFTSIIGYTVIHYILFCVYILESFGGLFYFNPLVFDEQNDCWYKKIHGIGMIDLSERERIINVLKNNSISQEDIRMGLTRQFIKYGGMTDSCIRLEARKSKPNTKVYIEATAHQGQNVEEIFTGFISWELAALLEELIGFIGSKKRVVCSSCKKGTIPFKPSSGTWVGNVVDYLGQGLKPYNGFICEKCTKIVCIDCSAHKAKRMSMKTFVCPECGHYPLKSIYR